MKGISIIAHIVGMSIFFETFLRRKIMNILNPTKKFEILDHLVEGCSIRSTERLLHTHRDTISKTLLKVGKNCEEFMNDKIKNFKSKYLQADEIWTFVSKKDKSLTEDDREEGCLGSQYLYIAMCAESKFVPSYLTGKRTKKVTWDFIRDLKSKMDPNGKVQLTTDGYNEYKDAVKEIFGNEIDYAQTIKHQGSKDKDGRYTYTISEPVIIVGSPGKKKISTSYVERLNLTVRMRTRRFTRKTNAFSKKLENLKAAISLHFFHYNFICKHMTLKTTPAVAAGVAKSIYSWDLVL